MDTFRSVRDFQRLDEFRRATHRSTAFGRYNGLSVFWVGAGVTHGRCQRQSSKNMFVDSWSAIASERFDAAPCAAYRSRAFYEGLDKFGGQKCRCSGSASKIQITCKSRQKPVFW